MRTARGPHADAVVARTAAVQHGLVTVSQLHVAGLTPAAIRTRSKAGRLELVHRAVYRIGGVPVTWQQSVLAACLAAGPQALASHLTAARLWGLGEGGVGIEVSVPQGVRRTHPGIVVHEARNLHPADRRKQHGIPLTGPARTIVDLAGHLELEALEDVVDEALRRRLTSIGPLRRRADALMGRGRAGSTNLRAVLVERDPRVAVPESVLERQFLRILKRAGLPLPVPQYVIRVNGRFLGRVDYAYVEERVAIELDGYAYHSGRRRTHEDKTRQNNLFVHGWPAIRFTARHLHSDHDYVVRTVTDALSSRRRR